LLSIRVASRGSKQRHIGSRQTGSQQALADDARTCPAMSST
jgi:hypothetical protein